VCVAVAVLIVGAAAYSPVRDWYDLRAIHGTALTSVGASTGVCGKVVTKKADGDKDLVPKGSQVTYSTAPPAFGAHWADTDQIGRASCRERV